MKKMNFEELVKIFEDETSFINKYDNIFGRYWYMGENLLYDDQEIDFGDVSITVETHQYNGAYVNELVIVPKTKKAKAARIAARRKLLSDDFPKEVFDRSIRTHFGWELVNYYLDVHRSDLNKLLSLDNRPETNGGEIDYNKFDKWLEENEFDPESSYWLYHLFGRGRHEALLTILYGDWRKMPTMKQVLWKKYVIS